jgi:hypothetical protein
MKTVHHFITDIERFPYRPTWVLDSAADIEGQGP